MRPAKSLRAVAGDAPLAGDPLARLTLALTTSTRTVSSDAATLNLRVVVRDGCMAVSEARPRGRPPAPTASERPRATPIDPTGIAERERCLVDHVRVHPG